jgi:hypothetical protein
MKNDNELEKSSLPKPPQEMNFLQLRQAFQNIGIKATKRSLQSYDYLLGLSGWKIDSNGDVEFNNGVFRGTFNIGGTVITINNTEDIQTNINKISTAGGGILYLQGGTYNLTDDIIFPSGVALKGVVRDDTILDFGGLAKGIKSIGADAYTAGTVSINDTESTVVGSGTTFTSAMVGQVIFLGNSYYYISAFSDTTHIDIETPYSGGNLSGANYTIATPVQNVFIGSVTVQNSSIAGIKMQYVINSFIDDTNVYSSGIGVNSINTIGCFFTNLYLDSNTENVNFDYTWAFTISGTYINNAVNNGFTVTNSGDATFFNSGCNNSGATGLSMTSCINIAFLSYTFFRNTNKGAELVSGCNDNQFLGGILDGNGSDALKITATSDRNIVGFCTIKNSGGWGINIAAATCDSNILNGVIAVSNSSGSITDSGTGTLKSTAVNVLP